MPKSVNPTVNGRTMKSVNPTVNGRTIRGRNAQVLVARQGVVGVRWPSVMVQER
jgi:hypothetical protein